MTRVGDKITGSVPVRERVVCECVQRQKRKKEESSFSYSPDFLQVSFLSLYQHLLLFLFLPLLVFPPRSRTLFREANQDE